MSRSEMPAEHRAIVIDALTDEIVWQQTTGIGSKAAMHYTIGLLEYRHRLMADQLAAQAAETHRLNGIINHPPRALNDDIA